MPLTALQRRRADAERKRHQRQVARAVGRPTPEQTYHAIAEATSFALLCADRRTWIESENWVPINVGVLVKAATDILVSRLGSDRAAAKKSVVEVLRPRSAHLNAGNVPSVTAGQSVYPALAPEAAIRPQQTA